MSWSDRFRRKFGNRYALTAVLFLLIMLWGAGTVFFGILNEATACAGYELPDLPRKTDLSVPGRERAGALPSAPADLTLPAQVPAWPERVGRQTAAAQAAVTQALEDDHSLIEVYGAFQALCGRTAIEDAAEPEYGVVRLKDGSLSFVGQGEPDPQVQAGELKRLQTALAQRDIPLLYCQAPSKLEPGAEGLPYGVEDTSNACADRLLAALDEKGVATLDLRQTLKDAGGDWGDWFYRTDHHWNQDAAFVSFQALAERLGQYTQTVSVGGNTRRQAIHIDPIYTDANSYDRQTLSRFFLGSQGKRVGSTYAGVDDFVLWTPTFPTLLRYTGASGGDRWGDLEETVLYPQRVAQRDLYGGNPYTYYAGGDYPFAQVTNYYNRQGPKVLLIRDSYACAMTPYLALACSQLSTIDPRSFSDDLLAYVDWTRPDVVVVLYSSGLVREEEPYRLLSQAPEPAKGDALRRVEK